MRRSTWLVGLTGLAVVGALAVGTSAQATGRAPAAGSSRTSVGAQHTVRLVTGDVVRLRTVGGRQTAQVVKLQHSGPGSVFRTYAQGGDEYVVPQSAVPYLGSTLDARLFDVTRLAQHPGLMLRIQTRSGLPAALAGLTVHARHGSTVVGSLTPAGAAAFGRALAQQSLRDHASPTHATGLFRDVVRIAPAAVAPAHPAPSGAADSVLTVNGIDWNGNPDNGDSYNIYNVDDMNLFSGSITFQNGTAQVTVPDGHYSAVGFFYDFTSGTIYQVTLAQFTVKGDTTVTVDARDATSLVSITTPKPSTPFSNAMGVGRSDANGLVGSYSFTAGDQPFYVAPIAQAPKVGKLYYWVYSRAFSSSGKGTTPYSYDLKFGSTGTISADQSYAPKAGSLAAIRSVYGADHKGQQSLDARFGAFPWEQFLIAADATHSAPITRVEYYNADRTLDWSGVDYQVYIPSPFTLLGEIDSSWRSYAAGYKATQPWGDDPAHPRLLQHDLFLGQTVCPACLAGTTLDGLAFPFGDNSEEHRTYPDSPTSGLTETSAWKVTADGSTVQQGTGVLQSAAPVGSASTYGLVYDTTRSSDDFRLSTQTHTAWTVPADAPQPALPAGWTCTVSGGTGCTVLPLMTVDYALPSSSLGRIKSGDVSGTVTIGHLAGARAKVRKLSFKVSYDGGNTYQTAAVSPLGKNSFTVEFTVPPKSQTDGYGAISLSARDANGATLKESVAKAFGVVGG